MTTLRANSELVTVAWIGSLPDLRPDMVATTLPEDTSKWELDGFVEVSVIGGIPGIYIQTRSPVVSVHGWAVASGSSRPPWGKASQLLEHVRAGCFDEDDLRRTLELPAGYPYARVNEAYPLSEITRVPGDQGAYAHFHMDIQLHWVEL